MFRVIVIFLSDDMAKIVLKSCETCNASTLLHTPAGDVRPAMTQPGTLIMLCTDKPLVHYLKWSSFVFSVQIYSRMHADLLLA